MARKSASGKYVELDNVRLSYNTKEDKVRLSSTDEDLSGEFVLTLHEGTRTDVTARELLNDYGVIKPAVINPTIDMLPVILGKAISGRQVYLVSGDSTSGRNTFIRSVVRAAVSADITTIEVEADGDVLEISDVAGPLEEAREYIEGHDQNVVITISSEVIDFIMAALEEDPTADADVERYYHVMADLFIIIDSSATILIGVDSGERQFRSMFPAEEYFDEIIFSAGAGVRYDDTVFTKIKAKPKYTYVASNPFLLEQHQSEPERTYFVGYTQPRSL
jgi:hypothetical protein